MCLGGKNGVIVQESQQFAVFCVGQILDDFFHSVADFGNGIVRSVIGENAIIVRGASQTMLIQISLAFVGQSGQAVKVPGVIRVVDDDFFLVDSRLSFLRSPQSEEEQLAQLPLQELM